MEFQNTKDKEVLRASRKKNRSHTKHQKSRAALSFSTFTMKTMRQWRMCLKSEGNHFQASLPYPSKSSLKGKIKIRFSVMPGSSNIPPMWYLYSTTHIHTKWSKPRKIKIWDPKFKVNETPGMKLMERQPEGSAVLIQEADAGNGRLFFFFLRRNICERK